MECVFAGEVRKSGKVLLVVRRVLYGIVAVIASVFGSLISMLSRLPGPLLCQLI